MLSLEIKTEKIGPILRGHPWVFSGAIKHIPDGIEPGTPVRLVNPKHGFLACGYFNSYSQIAVRIWGYDQNENIDQVFFVKRIKSAYETRKSLIESEDTDSYRLINGENDLLPGLIVDKYGDYLVVQFHTRGIETWKDLIISSLIEVLTPKGIYERSDVPVRKIEQINPVTGTIYGDVPDLIMIKENGFKFFVDVKHGQKTGFFLDQRDKRRAIIKYSKDRDILNCFSYTGGFAIYALAGGARHVTCVDVSKSSLDLARENLKINNIDQQKCEFVCEDVKKYLKNHRGDEFNLIVLDPPAFIKDRRKKKQGIVGYMNINESAFRILSEDGILVTCSCSAHLSMDEFRDIIINASSQTGKIAKILETYTHGIDHPQLVSFIEGDYLKCLFIKV